MREHEPYLRERLEQVVAGAPWRWTRAAAASSTRSSSRRRASCGAAGAAIREHGVIVRVDVRVNPCLAISPPLICTRAHIDVLAEGIAAGLRDVS